MKTDSLPCGCMDLIEIAHRDRIYPVIYCRMTVKGNLDQERLKDAVTLSADYVPEILYCVDYRKGCFVNRHLTADQVICKGKDASDVRLDWDLSSDVQLKIWILAENNAENLVIGMSHIVTDGSGFLQYLYLLCAIYNGEKPDAEAKNNRDIKMVFRDMPFFLSPGSLIFKDRSRTGKVLSELHDGSNHYCIGRSLNGADFTGLCLKAKSMHVSVNDVLLTAYSRVVSRRMEKKAVAIPCPADLRRISSLPDELTIGNMTGIYSGVSVTVSEKDSFSAALYQIHREIRRQKAEFLCCRGIRLLHFVHGRIPMNWLIRIIRMNYRLSPVSYTNIGKIDAGRLRFAACSIESCYLTGAYRKAADFQLTVSTFKDRCTLNCALVGNTERKTEGEALLEEIREELYGFYFREQK